MLYMKDPILARKKSPLINIAENVFRVEGGGAVRISAEGSRRNRALTDVNRRYFRVDGRFSAVNRR